MSLTLSDIRSQADYLVGHVSGMSYYFQDYEKENTTLEYDNGDLYLEIPSDTPVEATSHGTILMLGKEYRAYVAQQVKFETND